MVTGKGSFREKIYMKINLAKSSGFCFGVKRAIDMAMDLAHKYHSIEMLGDIVHNENVTKDIEKAGVKKIKALKKGRKKILLIRAHGIPLKIIERAKSLGYKIVDATCPMVKEIHRTAMEMEKELRRIIIIGDKRHAEVQGIVGHIKKRPIIIEDEKSIPLEKIDGINKACIVVQSTQNAEKVIKIFDIINRHIKDLKFFNTICSTTRKRQNEIRSMPKGNDIMIIIGSKRSANTKRLYQISKSLNKKSYWIQSKRDLKREWFRGIKSIGVTAGASTPDYTIKMVISSMRDFTKSTSR